MVLLVEEVVTVLEVVEVCAPKNRLDMARLVIALVPGGAKH